MALLTLAQRLQLMNGFLMVQQQHAADNQAVAQLLDGRRQVRQQQRRRHWVRQWLIRRPMYGMYEKLMGELEREDVLGFRNFIRIEPARFYELLQRIGDRITKQNTFYRKPDDPWAILWQRLPAPWSSWGAELSFASWPGFPSVRISPPGQWGPGYHLHWRNRVGVEYLYGRVGSWPWSCHVQKNPHDPFLLAWSNKKSMLKRDNAREVVSMSVCQSRDARCRL